MIGAADLAFGRTAARKLGKVSELGYLALGPAPVDYLRGWDLQRRIHARRVADEVPDSCLLLEHEPVYTAGKRTAASDRPFGDPGAQVIDVDRGGKITWHGPGQLTGYPIIKLREPIDVVAYVRALEQVILDTLAESGIVAGRIPGCTGVWVDGKKVAAIGVHISRWVTSHGFALNHTTDLSYFQYIVPCGITKPVTSMRELGAETTRERVIEALARSFSKHFQLEMPAVQSFTETYS